MAEKKEGRLMPKELNSTSVRSSAPSLKRAANRPMGMPNKMAIRIALQASSNVLGSTPPKILPTETPER